MIASLARLTPVAALFLAFFTCAHAAALDVDPWDRVLRAHAHEGGIDYGALKDDADARADLRAFIAHIATMEDDEPLSSWLNAYNAIVVSRVVERYPLSSVRDVPGFFDRIRHRVARQDLTLDDVEARIFRFSDARVHAALNCGARSCPPIPARAFRERGLSATLDRLMQGMVRSRAYMRIENGRIFLNEIFFWYDSEFRRDAGSMRAYLDRFDASRRLANVPRDASIERIRYDWRLNDRPRAR